MAAIMGLLERNDPVSFFGVKVVLARIALGLAALVAAPLAFSTPSQAVPVGLELSLLVDVSGSVDNSEYNLQKQGYVNAFSDPGLVSAILASTGGSIAVNFVQWSGA